MLCRACHTELENKSEEEREKLNNELIEYKARFSTKFQIATAVISNGTIQQAQIIEPDFDGEVIEIPLYDTTEEEYQEYLQKRRQRVLENEKWNKIKEERNR